ncbi:hypothetical protein [Allochromatium palmeri]|uniref:hypothetical protein n=1 Tax=Allochromatium palmeri TaxID=231048 RepID=UPI001643333A|nr:hypothetical protein [Allochromatium palmeri]
MIAFDTNMLVRLAVDDHPQQAEVAVNLLKQHRVLISRAVLNPGALARAGRSRLMRVGRKKAPSVQTR